MNIGFRKEKVEQIPAEGGSSAGGVNIASNTMCRRFLAHVKGPQVAEIIRSLRHVWHAATEIGRLTLCVNLLHTIIQELSKLFRGST